MNTYHIGGDGMPMIVHAVPASFAYDDPERLALWDAACDGDDVAKKALCDWYEERGFTREPDHVLVSLPASHRKFRKVKEALDWHGVVYRYVLTPIGSKSPVYGIAADKLEQARLCGAKRSRLNDGR